MATEESTYGYYSHNHAMKEGCETKVYTDDSGRQVLVTETGSTKIPEDSGYNYPQTILVGRITRKWKLIDTYILTECPDPKYLLDPEEEQWAA